MSRGPIMIMAGGTGGHVFPGLAVAAALRARDRRVVWLGTQRGLEARVVPPAGIDVEWISIAGVRGKGVLALVAAPFRIARALAQALGALRRRRPAAVLGMGGFVAGPGGFAAWLTRRPLLLHEQNAIAGTTNRLLAPLATRIFAAFPGSFPGRRDDEVIGNPVRATIVPSDSPRERLLARRAERRRLLVVGGSLGARILNQTLPRALAAIPADRRPEVWHQAHLLWPWFVVMLPAAGIVFGLDGVLIGAGDVGFLRTITIVGGVFAFAPLNLAALHWHWGIGGVWAGLTAFILVRLVGMLWRARGERWIVLGV